MENANATIFKLTTPLPGVNSTASVRGRSYMASKTILVVDDDLVFRTSLVDILNKVGYNAHGASDGGSAISIAEALGTQIDLIVLEMALPDMSGVALIEAFAVLETRAIIKVIASSSVFSQEDLETQTSFPAQAGIRKAPTGTPAIAAKWLLAVRGLLGEHADPVQEPLHHVILLVDDDSAVRTFVKMILNLEGYQVLEASDGESALALARKIGGNVDLLITDIEMPGMDGADLGKAIREAYPTIPLIYISGFTEDHQVRHLDDPEQGFTFVGKPFQPKILLETVARMLNLEPPSG
jgi:CheY-like chemotaxis protein